LLLHGIDATLERVEAAGRDIGKVIEGFVAANHADLLVMGAFGHSRMMEFILGGATRSILNHPPVPVLISH
jgi:nucleotide-binding universal stress UspA family protein